MHSSRASYSSRSRKVTFRCWCERRKQSSRSEGLYSLRRPGRLALCYGNKMKKEKLRKLERSRSLLSRLFFYFFLLRFFFSFFFRVPLPHVTSITFSLHVSTIFFITFLLVFGFFFSLFCFWFLLVRFSNANFRKFWK